MRKSFGVKGVGFFLQEIFQNELLGKSAKRNQL